MKVVFYYFEHNKKGFMFEQRFYPRYKADYVKLVTNVLSLFKQNKEPIKLIRKARLEYIFLDYLNKNFAALFENDYPNANKHTPYIYSGMLFNVSMTWLDEDCSEPIENLSELIINSIYFEK